MRSNGDTSLLKRIVYIKLTPIAIEKSVAIVTSPARAMAGLVPKTAAATKQLLQEDQQ